MRRTNPRNAKSILRQGIIILCCACVYFGGIYFALRNAMSAQELRGKSVTNEVVQAAISRSFLYDSNYFRTAAARLQYSAHDPAVQNRAFQLAVVKAPANAENLVSFAEYAANRKQLSTAKNLFREAVRRFPTDPILAANAGLTLFSAGETTESLEFLGKALAINPALTYDVYPLIAARGATFDQFLQMTPNNPEGILALCSYAVSKSIATSAEILELIEKTDSMDLEPQQHLQVSTCAMRAHLYPVARAHADPFRSHPILGGRANSLLEEINRLEKKQK